MRGRDADLEEDERLPGFEGFVHAAGKPDVRGSV